MGQTGRATAESLRDSGACFVWDDKDTARADIEAQGYILRDPSLGAFEPSDSLVLAPGIPLTHPEPHKAVKAARAAGVEIIGDIELLFRTCPQATYVGITGTNGKSTTTALIAHILEKRRPQSTGRRKSGNRRPFLRSFRPRRDLCSRTFLIPT